MSLEPQKRPDPAYLLILTLTVAGIVIYLAAIFTATPL